MEQHMQYLMWLKSKKIFKAPMNSFNGTWEEQAFAEDAAGLGGFVWPPRSYSCTFCRREFRSAQALGGHMNVHRRDRARLKQSLSLQTDQAQFENSKTSHSSGRNLTAIGFNARQSLNYSSLPMYQKKVQIENSGKTPSMLPGTQRLSQGDGLSSVSWASSKITQENSSVQSYVSPFSSFVTKEQRWSGYPSSPQGSDSNSARYLSISNSSTPRGKCAGKELITLDQEHTAETNLSVGINLGDSHNLQLGSDNGEIINSKRHKSTGISSFAFFHKPCSSGRYVFQKEVLRIKTKSLEDIDLELRLGDPLQ